MLLNMAVPKAMAVVRVARPKAGIIVITVGWPPSFCPPPLTPRYHKRPLSNARFTAEPRLWYALVAIVIILHDFVNEATSLLIIGLNGLTLD